MMNRSRRAPGNKPFVSGGNYDSQQNVQKPQVQTPQKQAMQPPVRTPQQAPVQQTPVQQEEQENVEVDSPKEESRMAIDNEFIDESGKLRFKKIFLARKKSSVRAKEKKIRQNRQLRKAILPKNALMALNEVKGVTISDFNINANTNGGFCAVVTVNDKQYEGLGSSKMSAKNSACEKALRDYVLEKMRLKPRLSKNQAVEPEPMETEENDDETKSQKDGEDGIADEVPMINLASFAIYKLFAEWESDGYDVPELHPMVSINGTPSESGSAAPKEPKKPTNRTDLPPNWEATHPCTLLCMMRPGLTYTEYGQVGEKPNVLQRVGTIVDEQEFIANGRSKKSARRNVATDACNTLFGTNFIKESVAAPNPTPEAS